MPAVLVTRWSLWELSYASEPSSRHLVGFIAVDGGGMVSKPIAEIYVKSARLRTVAGGRFHLRGAPGSYGLHLLDFVARMGDASQKRDITFDVFPLLAERCRELSKLTSTSS